MITILTPISQQQYVTEIIASIHRLNELVSVSSLTKKIPIDDRLITISENVIKRPLDWNDIEPPYLIPPMIFTKNHLLALVFYTLGNLERSFEYVSLDDELYQHLSVQKCLQFGQPINQVSYHFVAQQCLHNQCIVNQYGDYAERVTTEKLMRIYRKAIHDTEETELKAFTAKFYLIFLISIGQYNEAEVIVNSFEHIKISEEARNSLQVQKIMMLLPQLSYPFDLSTLSKIEDLLAQSVAFYEKRKLEVNAALLMIEDSRVAIYQEDFLRSKHLIDKAIIIFKKEEIPDFLGEATLQKAILLYTWSKKEQPQYYKSAINTFQDALKIFKQGTHPEKFAEIHHNMALIYSEIPASDGERSMWAAFCTSSFEKALTYYTKENFSYQYAMISHNYATALINFPQTKQQSHLDKAYQLFEDALEIRESKKYPIERASTLINQLELYWLLNNRDHEDETRKLAEMQARIDEVERLIDNDPSMIERIAYHKKQLEALKTLL